MENEILKDITDYIDFLRSVDFNVTLSGFDSVFNRYLTTLYEYEVHLSPVCSFLKSNPSTNQKCIKNKSLLKQKLPDKPYYSCCYAGVEEFIIPVRYEEKTIICINVSGYRGKMRESEFLKSKMIKRCGSRFKSLYSKLSASVPIMDEVLKFTKPLEYMFISLFEQSRSMGTAETPADRLYAEAIAFIYENYMNVTTCADVAAALNYSESYLRHIFTNRCGMSLAAFINTVRLNKAKELIENTSLSVSAVAADTGFCDANYFSTAFKAKFGLSPMRYRKR